jgi:hypothetical protein
MNARTLLEVIWPRPRPIPMESCPGSGHRVRVAASLVARCPFCPKVFHDHNRPGSVVTTMTTVSIPQHQRPRPKTFENLPYESSHAP